MRKSFTTTIFAIALAMLPVTPASAGVTVDQAFTWGTIGMTDNDSVSSMTILTNGNVIITGSIVQITGATPGIFTFDGLNVDTPISSVGVTVTVPMQRGGSETFTLDNFTTDAPASTTGDEAQITIGGRLRTTGSGTGYIDGAYNSVLEVTINY